MTDNSNRPLNIENYHRHHETMFHSIHGHRQRLPKVLMPIAVDEQVHLTRPGAIIS
jgi:hypothetical protein